VGAEPDTIVIGHLGEGGYSSMSYSPSHSF
jgi:hypothetical protein